MYELQKQFHKFLTHYRLIEDGDKVLLAVSGGLDSMVMANLFLNSDIEMAVAHCNFGLRGAESEADEQFVKEWASKNGIECYTKHLAIKSSSIQLEARRKRYEWFIKLAADAGCQKISTAHHLNDSLETSLLNFTRGTGVRGLAGVPMKNGNIIRPLLHFSKEQLAFYAGKNRLAWREDGSNQKSDYDRNKLRLKVIPLLKELNKSLEDTFRPTAERLEYASELLQERANEIYSNHFNEMEQSLALDWITKPSHLLLLNEILAPYGFNYKTVREVFDAVGNSGKTFETGNWSLFMDRNKLYLKTIDTEMIQPVIVTGQGKYSVGEKDLLVDLLHPGHSVQELISKDLNTATFDASKVTWPLTVRRWQHGDALQPIGMLGKKKVSDLLIDLKVPLAKKAEVLIVESAGEIAWVVGYRISDNFKMSKETSEVVSLEYRSHA